MGKRVCLQILLWLTLPILIQCEDRTPADIEVIDLDPPVQLYADSGFIVSAEIWTWSGAEYGGPESLFDAEYEDPGSPEGSMCFRVTSGSDWANHQNYAGWGIFMSDPEDHVLNLSHLETLQFMVKTPRDLKLEIQEQDRYGEKSHVWISNHGWAGEDTWQAIAVPLADFSGARLDRVFCPFMLTATAGDITFYVDDVKFTGSAN